MGTLAELRSRLEAGETIDLRADGKAGCGLVLTLQVFARAVSTGGTYQAQEWPLFSSARKGANVRGFLRMAKAGIDRTCQIERPEIVLLFNEKTGEELDVASGTSSALFVINSADPPRTVAGRLGLAGEVFCVAGDRLGQELLGRPIPNISVLAALHKALPLVSVERMLEALQAAGSKRRLPGKMVEANRNCFIASLQAVRSETIPGEKPHPPVSFPGYSDYPVAAQSRLRTSLGTRAANYAPAGRRLVFQDPQHRCNGCSLCIVNCPEGIIQFTPDEKQGVRVTGADVDQFCKLCRECIEVCPVDLFDEVAL